MTDAREITNEYGETKNVYLFANVNYQNYNLDSDSDKASKIAVAIFKTMLLDHPEFYFISNIVYYNGITIKPTCNADYKDGAARTLYKTKIEQYKAAVKEEFTIFDNTEDKYSVVGFPALIPGINPPFCLIVFDTSAGLNVAYV